MNEQLQTFWQEHKWHLLLFGAAILVSGGIYIVFGGNSSLFQGRVIDLNTPDLQTVAPDLANIQELTETIPAVTDNIDISAIETVRQFDEATLSLDGETDSDPEAPQPDTVDPDENEDPEPEQAGDIESDDPTTTPEVSNVEIEGNALVGEILLGTYNYVGEAEENSAYEWLRSNEEGEFALVIQEGLTYETTAEDLGMMLAFQVTPRSAQGPTLGEPVLSAPFGPIVEENLPETKQETDEETIVGKEDPEETVVKEEENAELAEEIVVLGDPETEVETNTETNTEAGDEAFVIPDFESTENDQFVIPDGLESAEEQPVSVVTETTQSTQGNLNSNTNAAVLAAADIQGNTGPQMLLIVAFAGGAALFTRRRDHK